jgi:hypothetical protein
VITLLLQVDTRLLLILANAIEFSKPSEGKTRVEAGEATVRLVVNGSLTLMLDNAPVMKESETVLTVPTG